jgi:hypothetical protein
LTIDLTEITTLLSDLVAIDPINPGLHSGGAGQAVIAGFVVASVEKNGLHAK